MRFAVYSSGNLHKEGESYRPKAGKEQKNRSETHMIADKEEIHIGQVIVHILDSTVGMPVLSDKVLILRIF